MQFCSLTVKEEVNIFPSASHSNLEAEGKMWWGLEGLRIRDASRVVSAGEGQGVFSLADDARHGEPTNE
jgi:hypothetical protein